MHIDEELMLLLLWWGHAFDSCDQCLVSQVEMGETEQDWRI